MMSGFDSKVYHEIKAILQQYYVVVEDAKYTDTGQNAVIVPTGRHTRISKTGTIEIWNSVVNIFLFRECNFDKIRELFDCFDINENFVLVQQEMGSKAAIEYRRFSINHKSVFNKGDKICNLACT